MAHVVIPDQTPRVSYAVGGTPLDTFPVPFVVFAPATDLAVYVGAALASYSPTPSGSLQYSVETFGAADDGFSGGSITLGATVSNTTVVIERAIPIDRLEDFPYPSNTLAIRALNRGLDRVAAWGQQLRRDIGRALRLPPADPVTDLLLPAAAGRAGKIVGFASDGSLLLFTITGTTVSVYAQWAGTAGGTANARTPDLLLRRVAIRHDGQQPLAVQGRDVDSDPGADAPDSHIAAPAGYARGKAQAAFPELDCPPPPNRPACAARPARPRQPSREPFVHDRQDLRHPEIARLPLPVGGRGVRPAL